MLPRSQSSCRGGDEGELGWPVQTDVREDQSVDGAVVLEAQLEGPAKDLSRQITQEIAVLVLDPLHREAGRSCDDEGIV